MPFILIIIGLIVIVSAVQGTQGALGQQLVTDFTGPGNFVYWIVAILVIGGLGYVDDLRTPSRTFILLLLLVLFLSNKGFFAQFSNALKTGPKAPASSGGGSSSSGGLGSLGGSSGGGASVGTVAELAALA